MSRPALLIAGTCLLLGCTSEQGEPPAGAASSAPATSSVAPDPTRTTVDDRGGVGAHKDLASSTCTADSQGVWSSSAGVDNPTKAKQDYTVEVSVVDP